MEIRVDQKKTKGQRSAAQKKKLTVVRTTLV